jgi:hypothetical protein
VCEEEERSGSLNFLCVDRRQLDLPCRRLYRQHSKLDLSRIRFDFWSEVVKSMKRLKRDGKAKSGHKRIRHVRVCLSAYFSGVIAVLFVSLLVLPLQKRYNIKVTN